MVEEELSKSAKAKLRKREKDLLEFTIEKRIIDGKEVEIKIYKETKKRPIGQVCR